MKYTPTCYICKTLLKYGKLSEFNDLVDKGLKNKELIQAFNEFTRNETKASRISIWRHKRHLITTTKISETEPEREAILLRKEEEMIDKELRKKARFLPKLWRLESFGLSIEYPFELTDDEIYRYNQIQLARNMDPSMKKKYLLQLALDVEERIKKQRSPNWGWIAMNPRKYGQGKWGKSAKD